MKPLALVLKAPGTNRDRDALEALELAGGSGEIVPLAALRSRERRIMDYGLLVLPGGFSYGDALGAGALMALDLGSYFAEEVGEFVASGRPVLGICNGFQALVKSGILPGGSFREPGSRLTLTRNASGRFECRWVELAAPPSPCLWTEGLEGGISCPVAHGEGRLAAESDAALGELRASGLVALVYARRGGASAGASAKAGAEGAYPENPNGSIGDIAGLCNEAGNVLGLMPHPEDAILPRQFASLPGRGSGGALALFANGLRRAKAL